MVYKEAQELVNAKGTRREKWRIEEMRKNSKPYKEAVKKAMLGWEEFVNTKIYGGSGGGNIIDEVWNDFKRRLISAMRQGVGKKIVSGKARTWWNTSLEQCKKEKDKAYRALRDCITEDSS